MDRKDLNNADPPWPTESEFVDYIIDSFYDNDEDDLNAHWRPQYKLCPFCSHDFDVVGKMETFQEDKEFILRKIAPGNSKSLQDIHAHNSHNPGLEAFLSKLNRYQLRILYELYRTDFEMFGYVGM